MPSDLIAEPPATQAQETATTSTADEPKYMTRAEFETERNRMFADMRRANEAQQSRGKSPAPKAKDDQSESAGVDIQSVLRRERELSEAFEDVGVSREGRGILRRLVDAERPENVAEFIATHAKAFARPSPATAATTSRPAAPTNAQPVSDAGSPAAPVTITDDTPLWQLKDEDRDFLIKKNGHGWYANKLRSQLKGTRFRLR
jgi:CCR4-NOT transcriptional regulation complex NOT5 subunit